MILNRIAALAIAFTTGVFSPALAQDGASFNFSPLTIDGLVVGNRYVLDAEFAARYDVPVPAPFEIVVPTGNDYKIYVQPAPGDTGIIKFTFTTPDDLVQSNLQFVPLSIDMAPIEDRLSGLRPILGQAMNTSVPDPERSSVVAVRNTEVGPYPAIEAIVQYDGGADGLVILRLVAIPGPESRDGMLVVINALVKNNNMRDVQGVFDVVASRALESFRFN